MNSEVPKWTPPESAECFPNRSEEASQKKTEEEKGEEEMEKCKLPRATLDSEEGVEEFLVLLERIEEMKKHLKRKRTNCSVNGISGGGGINVVAEMSMAMPSMQQAQGSLPDAVDMISYKKRRASPWKPSFQWEDFNRSCNSLSAKTDLSPAAAAEKNEDIEEARSIQIGNGRLQTIQFLDGHTPAECSRDPVDDVSDKENGVDAPPELELQLFFKPL